MGLAMGREQWRRIFLGSAVDVEMDSAARVLVQPELRAENSSGYNNTSWADHAAKVTVA